MIKIKEGPTLIGNIFTFFVSAPSVIFYIGDIHTSKPGLIGAWHGVTIEFDTK